MRIRSSFWAVLAIALSALATLPTLALAATYEVTTLSNLNEVGGGPCATFSAPCSLRDAIDAANETVEADTIEFAVAGKLETGVNPLPLLTNPVTIDGTSAPGYEAAGHPVVELDGGESGGLATGFEVEPEIGAVEVKILGFAIHGFGTGIVLDGEKSQVCASYIGTNLAGTASEPNKRGIEILIEAKDAQIGVGGGCVVGNVISGNEGFGIFDRGLGTVIAGNLIGTDPGGLPLGNGGLPLAGGVMISSQSGGAKIGAPGGGAAANTIAYNIGPGVGVEEIGLTASIRGNSIYYNAGFGIEFGNPDLQPPALEEVEAEVASTSVSATMSGEPNHTYEIEFFANEQCDVTGGGEGQTLIGEIQVETDAGGTVQFEAPALAALPPFMEVVTATATDPAITTTSAFSGCRAERPGPPALTSTTPGSGANDNAPKVVGTAPEGTTVSIYGEKNCGGSVIAGGSAAQLASGIAAPVADNTVTEFSALVTRPYAADSTCSEALSYAEVTPPPPPAPAPSPAALPITPLLSPVPSNGESVVVAPEEGKVTVKRPGQGKYQPLKEGQTIPIGSIVDATKGKVLLDLGQRRRGNPERRLLRRHLPRHPARRQRPRGAEAARQPQLRRRLRRPPRARRAASSGAAVTATSGPKATTVPPP